MRLPFQIIIKMEKDQIVVVRADTHMYVFALDYVKQQKVHFREIRQHCKKFCFFIVSLSQLLKLFDYHKMQCNVWHLKKPLCFLRFCSFLSNAQASLSISMPLYSCNLNRQYYNASPLALSLRPCCLISTKFLKIGSTARI